MSVLVDTSVWLLALRRKAKNKISVLEQETIAELSKLIDESRALIIGPVRQELLTGLIQYDQYLKLKRILRAFPEASAITEDFETAAELSNRARSKGVNATHVDSLIWAMTRRLEIPLFTNDLDFQRFSKIAAIKFWKV